MNENEEAEAASLHGCDGPPLKPKGWIRWKGLTGFAAFSALLALFWYACADALLRWTVEEAGSRALGARVDLAQADISLRKGRMVLHELQLTNPDRPMTNAVEIQEIGLDFSLSSLLKRKLLVQKMTIQLARLNTRRAKSGAIDHGAPPIPPKRPRPQGPQAPSFSFPDPKEILEKERLETLRLIEAMEAHLDRDQADYRAGLAHLPRDKDIQKYKSRLQRIKDKKDWKKAGQFAKDLEKDIQKTGKLGQDLHKAILDYEEKMHALKKAPAKDAKRLRETYVPSGQGIGNAGRILFGDAWGQWIDTAWIWQARILPYLRRSGAEGKRTSKPLRGKGTMVHFKERDPMPTFLIKQAELTMLFDFGMLRGEIANVTEAQDITQKPTTISLSGEALEGLESVRLTATLNHTDPASPVDTARLRLRGHVLERIPLRGIPARIARATADLDLTAMLAGEKIEATLEGRCHAVKIDQSTQASDTWRTQFASALTGVEEFDFHVRIKGTRRHYEVEMATGLDEIFRNAAGDFLKQQAGVFEKDLLREIRGKFDTRTDQLGVDLQSLKGMEQELGRKLNGLKSVFRDSQRAIPKGLPLGL